MSKGNRGLLIRFVAVGVQAARNSRYEVFGRADTSDIEGAAITDVVAACVVCNTTLLFGFCQYLVVSTRSSAVLTAHVGSPVSDNWPETNVQRAGTTRRMKVLMSN